MRNFISCLIIMMLTPLVFADREWVQDKADMDADPKIRWGKLLNGLHYAVMHNEEPPGQVSLRLLVRSGSLHETDKQHGLAHFLEHMAFLGSENYQERELIEYFQRAGMLFGHHLNAHTGFDETVYKLEVPTKDREVYENGFMILRDYADRLLLQDKKFQSERGVILSELRDGLSVDRKILDKFFEFSFPDTLVAERLPIGTEETLNNATVEDIKDYYKKWYRADRMFVVAVGDADVEEMEKLIRKNFEGMTVELDGVEEPYTGHLKSSDQRFKVHKEPEATKTDVSLFVVSGGDAIVDSRARRINEIKLSVAYSIITDRLNKLKRKPDSVFLEGDAYYMDFLNKYEYAGIGLKAKPGMWKETLEVAEQELRRAIEHGFSDSELRIGKARTLNQYEQRLKSSEKVLSRTHSANIVASVSKNKVHTSYDLDLELATEALKDLDARALHNIFSQLYQGAKPMVFITGNNDLDATNEAVELAYAASVTKEVFPPENEVIADFKYQNFGPAGNIIYHYHDKKIDVDQYQFENHVRLNLKKTDFQKDVISISVRIGEGEVEMPEGKEGLVDFTTAVFKKGGLEAHSLTEIEQIFAGDTVSLSFAVSRDAFTLTGQTSKDDLRKQLNLFMGYVLHPAYREEAYVEALETFKELYRGINLTPEKVMANEVDRFLVNGDHRFGYPDKDKLFSLTMKDVKSWLEKPLKEGYIEVSIVGDFDEEIVLKDVSETFGALPSRAKFKDISDKVKTVQFPVGVGEKRFDVKSAFEKGITFVCWPSDDIWDIRQSRQLSLLGQIFSDRLRKEVREKLGEAYSPYAVNEASKVFKGYGRFYAIVPVQPDASGLVSDIIVSIANDMYLNGISEDEMKRAQEPLLTLVEQQDRNNAYWLGHLSDSQENPEKLYWLRSRYEMYKNFSLLDINGVARKFLSPESAVRIEILPEVNEAMVAQEQQASSSQMAEAL